MPKNTDSLSISAPRVKPVADFTHYSDSVAPKNARALVGRINDGLQVGIGRMAAKDGAKAKAFEMSKGESRQHFFLELED